MLHTPSALNPAEKPDDAPAGPHRGGASVVENIFDVLRCFTTERPLVGVTEIAEQVGLHKSSVSRLLATLEQQRIVERDERSRKFTLGLGLISIAAPLLANLDVRRVANASLWKLAEETAETVVLSIWDEGEAVSVEQIPSTHRVKHTSDLGSRYRAALNSTVQVFLAYGSPERTHELVSSGQVFLPSHLTAEAYLRRLEGCREHGYAVNYGELAEDEVGVAAPVFDHTGKVVAAVMIAAPKYRVSQEHLAELVRCCKRAAENISTRLGHS